MGEHYVYGLFRPDDGCVFYIGLGRGDRAWQHAARRCRGRSLKDNLICELIDDRGFPGVPVVVLANNLTREAASALERAMIAALGRYPDGPLTNAQAGGCAPIGRTRHTAIETATRLRQRMADPDYQRMLAERARLAWPLDTPMPDMNPQSPHWRNWWNGF
jgi:hypothetical protein